MSSRQIQVSNPENWLIKAVVTKNAQPTGEKSYIPIGEFDTGVTLTSPFFLAEVTCNEKKTTWEYGGSLRLQYPVDGFFVYGKKFSLTIGKTLLIVADHDLAISSYGLRYASPKWFKDLTLTIWEYIGTVEDMVDIQLNSIEQKIDQLL